ncbi:MAG TPA: hypothetical protein VJX23_16555 [Candidatus Binataceae bacterium]|nr:hypothetical protein [Candidatus Binataceae bacterium]
MDIAKLRDLPDSPVGRRLKWYLGMLLSGGDGASMADNDRYTPEAAARLIPTTTDEEKRNAWRGFAAQFGAISDIAVASASDFQVAVIVAAAKDRRWKLVLEVESQPPHRIARTFWERQYDFKVEVREAVEADGPTLADIERRCPIVLGETKIYFDRSADYFAFARLMEDRTIGLASVDGVPAAVSCGAKHRVKIGGVDRWIVTVVHLRVLPEHQRKGLWGAANRVLDKYWDSVDGSCAYIAVDNAGMQHGFINTPNKWSVLVFRVNLSCADQAGPPSGRQATLADASAIVEVLNTFHADEEMYFPYTTESFTARVERAPNQYSWEKLWMTENAIVGVWPAGDSVKVVSESSGGRTESKRGMVLDYAFRPGAEKEFEKLLRAWCAILLGRGMETLSIFTSPASPGCALIRSLAREVEEFNMWTPGIAEPPDAADHGLYVDPVYF